MKRQFMVLLIALPVCLVAGAWPAVTAHHSLAAVSFTEQAWAMLLSLYHSIAQLPETGTLLALAACCFVMAGWLYRRWTRSQG